MDLLEEIVRQRFLLGMIFGFLIAIYPIFLFMLFKKLNK